MFISAVGKYCSVTENYQITLSTAFPSDRSQCQCWDGQSLTEMTIASATAGFKGGQCLAPLGNKDRLLQGKKFIQVMADLGSQDTCIRPKIIKNIFYVKGHLRPTPLYEG